MMPDTNSRILYTPRNATASRRRPPSHGQRWIMQMLVRGRLGILIIFAIFIAMIGALRVPQWQIQNIIITGLTSLDNAALISAITEEQRGAVFWLIPKTSFFLTRTQEITALLRKKFPKIATAVVVKEFPATLRIHASERVFWAIFCTRDIGADAVDENAPVAKIDSQSTTTEERLAVDADNPSIIPDACIFLDPSGFGYDASPRVRGTLLLTISSTVAGTIGTQVIDEPLAAYLHHLIRVVEQAAGSRVTAVTFSQWRPGEMNVGFARNFSLFINNSDNPEGVAGTLRTVLKEEIKDRAADLDYVDLRFGNKVFYKYR